VLSTNGYFHQYKFIFRISLFVQRNQRKAQVEEMSIRLCSINRDNCLDSEWSCSAAVASAISVVRLDGATAFTVNGPAT